MESTRTLDSVLQPSPISPIKLGTLCASQSSAACTLYYKFEICTISDLSHDRYLVILPCVMKTGQGQAGNLNYLENKETTQ